MGTGDAVAGGRVAATDPRGTRAATIVLVALIVTEGTWVTVNIWRSGNQFWHYLGFATDLLGKWPGWVAAAAVTAAFVAYSASRLPSVRSNLIRPSVLKALALVMAFYAGILEEVFFRKALMDRLAVSGVSDALQVIASGMVFGAVHGLWGLVSRSLRAAAGATLVTGLLGGALAVVYLLSGRSLAPCIAAHALLTPWRSLGSCWRQRAVR